MSADYRLELKVRNNRILRRMEELGHESVAAFCRDKGFYPTEIGYLVNMKRSALTKDGDWRVIAVRLADALLCLPADLWTDAQRQAALKTNRAAVEISEEDVSAMLGVQCPHEALSDKEASRDIGAALATLSHKYERVMRLRFGLNPEQKEYTYRDIAAMFGVGHQRIRQIEQAALQRLGRPHAGLTSYRPGG